MPLYSPLFLHVIYEIYFQRGGKGLLSKLPFPCFGKLHLTDTEVESSAVGAFNLLRVTALTVLTIDFKNKNVNISKIKKEVSVYKTNWLLPVPQMQ